MQFQAEVLSHEEQIRVHEQSLRILAEVGVRYHGKKALKILADAGAWVDQETHIVKIPSQLIEKALAAAPKSFTLGARNPQFDLQLPSPISYYCMDGTAAFALDFETGERRYGVRQDIHNAMRIFQGLDLGRMAWAPTAASDVPAHSRAIHEFIEMARYCSKHGEHELHSVSQVPYLVAGLSAILGGEAELRRRKAYSLIYCPVAPLTHDGEMLDAYLALGEYEMPVMIMPMPIPGSTGPASLFANLSLANAEVLSTFVVFQLAHPGRPLIYSSAVGNLDFRTGDFLGGTPEMSLQSAALTVMGRFYNLPSSSAGCTSDAQEPGAQAVFEKLLTTLPPVLVGADIIVGIGEIQGDQLLVLEQMIVDHEIARQCQRLFAGIDSSENKSLFEDIARVGPGGHFLATKSSRQAPRSGEFYFSKLLERSSYETWLELGKPSMYTKARLQVQNILSSPIEDPLSETVNQQVDDILRRADEELAG